MFCLTETSFSTPRSSQLLIRERNPGEREASHALYTLSSTLNGFRLPSQANVRSNNSCIVSHLWLRVIRSCRFHHTRSIGLQSGLYFGSRCNSIRSRWSHRYTATSSLVWHFALSQITWTFRYRRNRDRRPSRWARNSAVSRPCFGLPSVTNTWPVRQWIDPDRYRFSLFPGVSTVACSPLTIHIDPILGLVLMSTSSWKTAVSSAGSPASRPRSASSLAWRSGSFGPTTGRGRRYTSPPVRSQRRTVSRLTVTSWVESIRSATA